MITPADTPPTAPEQMPASSWNIQAPYVAGTPSLIAGAARDDMSSSVDGAQAAAEARYGAHEADTHGLGSTLGTLMTLPSQDFSLPNAHEVGYTGERNQQ